ncbi:inositol monophosphatase family protein [Streptomyces sp. NPDC058294]|uniref:inositol monophosphatase family protein n=1 Tax=Streptomyces sp. NPDC058294 TaxID=3346430 RepID=UPI0036EF1178
MVAQVATGRADALWAPGLQPWDCAAGVLLVQRAGGTVGDLTGPTPGTGPATAAMSGSSAGPVEVPPGLLTPVYPRAEGMRHGRPDSDDGRFQDRRASAECGEDGCDCRTACRNTRAAIE